MMPGTIECRCAAGELIGRTEDLLARGGRMQMAYGWFPAPGLAEVRYVAAAGSRQPLEVWRCEPRHGALPSLAGRTPLLGLVRTRDHGFVRDSL